MQLKGKPRLLLVGAAVLAVILVFTFISSRSSGGQNLATPAATATAASAPGSATTATPEQLSTLGSWGLAAADLPAGTVKLDARAVPLYVAARNDPAAEKNLQAQGFIEGYEQQWEQRVAQFQFADTMDLFQTQDQAKTRMALKPSVGTIQELPNPKIGDASRMYSATTNPSNGQQKVSYVIEWVRGRVLLTMTGASLPGGLQSDQILALAKLMDKRAAAAPLK